MEPTQGTHGCLAGSVQRTLHSTVGGRCGPLATTLGRASGGQATGAVRRYHTVGVGAGFSPPIGAADQLPGQGDDPCT